MNSDTSHVANAHLAEYDALKSEQLKRIEHRDQIVYLQIVVIGALLGLKGDFTESLVGLIIPFPCIALGWIYLVNDQKISAIGRYLRTDLMQRYADNVADESIDNIFHWEDWNANEPGRRFRKFIHLVINIFVFIMPGVLGLIISTANSYSLVAVLVIAIESLMLLIILTQFVSYSDFKLLKRE